MTQRLELSVAPVRISAELQNARRHHIAWMTSYGLLRSEKEQIRYDAWALPDLIGYSFPVARGTDVNLLVDILGWFTVIDDLFDGPTGRSPDAAAAVVTPLVDTMWSDDAGPTATDRASGLIGTLRDLWHRQTFAAPGDRASGLIRAWQDLWHRQTFAASADWRLRAAQDWEACLETFLKETGHRYYRTAPTLGEGVLLRRHASCLYPFMNMLERVTGYPIPVALIGDSTHERLRASTADVATYVNDLYSLEREERQGQGHNMVLILQRLHGLSRSEAIEEVSARVYELIEECDRLNAQLAQLYPTAHQYLRGMRTLIDGVYLWTSTSRRYAY